MDRRTAHKERVSELAFDLLASSGERMHAASTQHVHSKLLNPKSVMLCERPCAGLHARMVWHYSSGFFFKRKKLNNNL